MWNSPNTSGSVVVSEINVFARSENSAEDTDTSDVAGRDRERTVRGLLFNFVYNALDESYGDIGKIRRARREQTSCRKKSAWRIEKPFKKNL